MKNRTPIVLDRWALAGRERQLQVIEDVTRSPHHAGLVLCGAAGVGKTRLAAEVLGRFSDTGRTVEWVTATRATAAIPLGAVSHLLPEETRPVRDRLSVLRGVVARFVEDRADGGDPVIAVDDAHLLDDASAAVLYHLALYARVFLLVTSRTGARCPDAMTALWKEGRARRLELPELSADAVHTLLERAFHGRLDPASERRISRLGAGNPLLLRETLRAGLDTGVLRCRQGTWHWDGPVRPTTRLVDVVADHLGRVGQPVTRVLELVTAGEPLPVAILERLADPDAVATAERQGLVDIRRSGNRTIARLVHPLYGDVVTATQGEVRARAVAGELAEALADTPMRRRDDALRAGVWQLRSGRPGDPALLLAAAGQAVSRLDNTLAERLARAARDSGGGRSADHDLARILSYLGRFEESWHALPAVPDTADTTTRIRWAIVRSDVLFWGLGRVSEAERTLVDAGSAPGHRAAEASHAFLLLFDSRCREALRIGETVLGYPDAEPQALVWAAGAAIASAGVLGDHDRARALYLRGMAVAGAHPDEHNWRMQVCCAYCIALLAVGRVEEACGLADREYRVAIRSGTPELVGVWAGYRGVAGKARGDLATAVRALRESLTLLAGYDTFRLAAPCLAEFAGARALSGDGGRAERLLVRALHPLRRPSRLFVPWMELDHAWTCAGNGDRTTAATTALRAAGLARHAGQPTIEGWALYDAARLGSARAVRGRLAELACDLPGTVLPVFARAAEALAAGDGDQLWHAAREFRSLGMQLHAAEAAASAGRYSRSRSIEAWVAEILRRYPHARTPLLDKVQLQVKLTRREREVALLAVAGRSSRRIAGQLGLSVRTVDNHLNRVYGKFGVHSRAELSAALAEPDHPGDTHDTADGPPEVVTRSGRRAVPG